VLRRYGLRHTTKDWRMALYKERRTSMKVLDAGLKVVRWLLIWTCIPALIVVVYLSKELIESSQKKTVCVEKRLTAL
jgi:hypothetical protein